MADQYEELRRALADGPTPGPWNHVTFMSGTQNVEFPGARGVTFIDEVRDAEVRAICSDNDTKPFPWLDVHHRPEDKGDDRDPQRTRNAAYIAAANPQTIAALLAELDALREDARRMRMALTRLLDSHRGGYPLGAALNFADEVLHPSKDADSGEVGHG